jgi:hypothetical protein
MDINQKLMDLYRREFSKAIAGLDRVGYYNIIRGGVISAEAYSKSKKKLVVILKEGWATEPDRWNWPEAGQKQIDKVRSEDSCERTWQLIYTMGDWNYIVQKDFKQYERFRKQTKVERAAWFECIGITNIKKGYGKKTSDNPDIWYWGEHTAHIWKEELKIMNPDIVICGSIDTVYEIVTRGLRCHQTSEIPIEGRSFPHSRCYLRGGKEIIVIGLYHPSAYAKDKKLSLKALMEMKRQGLI